MYLFTVFILSLFLTLALVPVFKRLAFRMNIVDMPDKRKVHAVPMPKTGGISMAIGAFVPMLMILNQDAFVSSIFIGALIIVIFGLKDDIQPMSARQKILPQIVAGLIVILYGGVKINYLGDLLPESYILPDSISIGLTLFVIVGVTNAINLSDGLDGLAGGVTLLSFILIMFLAYDCGNQYIAVIAVAMIGSIIGFLRYNTHPAILFMGDAGSQLLGFILVVLAIMLTQSNTPYSKVLALPLIGFPILDTLTVMSERIVKKQSPFLADKKHFHHRLLGLGLLHTEAVFSIYIIQACFISMALIFRFYSDWVPLLGFVILSMVILLFFYITGRSGWKVRRQGVFAAMVKKRLVILKEKKIFIRLAFGVLRYGFYILFGFQVMAPVKIPVIFSVVALGWAVVIGIIFLFDFDKLKYITLKLFVYLLTPPLIYLSEKNSASWLANPWQEINNLLFIVLVLSMIATLNLTMRKRGFKITTMDILVFIIILIFPNLPTLHFETLHIGLTLAKVLVLLFCYDILIGELRKETNRIVLPMEILALMLALRGFF